MRTLVMILAALVVAGCEVNVEQDTEVAWLQDPGMEEMNLPFSSAVRVDNLLFLSGQLGYDREAGALVEGGIQAETQKTLENIKATLENHGSSMDKVVKCTVFLEDMAEWGAMNEIYTTFFTNKPADA